MNTIEQGLTISIVIDHGNELARFDFDINLRVNDIYVLTTASSITSWKVKVIKVYHEVKGMVVSIRTQYYVDRIKPEDEGRVYY